MTITHYNMTSQAEQDYNFEGGDTLYGDTTSNTESTIKIKGGDKHSTLISNHVWINYIKQVSVQAIK